MNPQDAAAGPVLRDIHLPPAPSWWPPAPGWWLLALLAVAVLAWSVRALLRRNRARRWRARVHAALDRIAAEQAAQPDPARCAAAVSQLLRRASALVSTDAPSLRGTAWLDFLDRQLPAEQSARAPFAQGPGRILLDTPFRAPADPALATCDLQALLTLARDWLHAALPQGREHA